ncbi:MAG: GNAT family N-acetyltransferase [Candidatus Competibacter sp.]|nr:GNAT family N-acetyltransferase [Candidatus Competibacter sp.]MDG4606905.1 GNAT family N-acetyltransferase [Candidatus Contendobacter sp.]HRD48346.1 GNAT family N-acetyltransferase [Candidatus Contendobacter sp.]
MIKSFERLIGSAGLQMLEPLWKKAVEIEGCRRRFIHSYHYYFACLQASQIVGQGPPELEFITACFDKGESLIAPFERVTHRYMGYAMKILRSPIAIYVPYWDVIGIPQLNNGYPTIGFGDVLKAPAMGRWDIVQLYNVLEDSLVLSQLEKNHDLSWECWELPRCDYLICQSMEEFLGGLSKNFRASLRKARNKLQKLKDIEFRSHREPEFVQKALQTFFMLEMAGWKSDCKGAIAQNLNIRQFYEILFNEYSKERRAWCEINELCAEGKILASQICLGVDDTLYILKVAYDENYSHVSPGNMLLEWVLTRFGSKGSIRYLNLISDSAWHTDWKASFLKNWYIEIYNKTPGGSLMHAMRLLQRRLGKKPFRFTSRR